ncbi:MAG: glycoside hydrolase family 2 TIM barrel-domain containing protein [Pyrinomonadaceae bacterium]
MKTENKLDRRSFLKTGAIGAATVSLLANSSQKILAEELTVLPNQIARRQIFPLNHGWLYSEKFTPEAVQPKFNDKNFKIVNLPHTNKMMPLSGFDEQDYCFVSIYRKKFRLPESAQGKRVFIDFGGVMMAARVFLNGQLIGENKGGFNDFSFELTKNINSNGENVLAVEVDSTERKDIPPFGNMVDYLTFGGIYRDVSLRVVNETFIENVFAKPVDILTDDRKLNIRIYLAGEPKGLILTARLFDGEKSTVSSVIDISGGKSEINLDRLNDFQLWDVDNPKLYKLTVTLSDVENSGREKTLDVYQTRIGFREAKFTEQGFFLNGKPLKLRGLNRHQTFPWIGQAMPARVQQRDAWILRKELKCNIVRTSHYMQSPHFLDACDEYGLLVLEEIPGWQHIGDKDWQDLAVRDVEAMIRRDRNHPSIVLWGVRINESGDNHDFYARTNAAAHELDDSRQTGGVRNRYDSEKLEDVFTMNDFRFPLRPPRHPLYLVTETNGHMYPTKRADNIERIREHAHRHARFHDQIASDPQYAGGLAWCAFDYNTHDYFGSGDRICYHGVSDIFRIPKPAAGFYRSQCEPSEEIVLEPAFDWARGDENETFTDALVCSNCEKLKFYIGDRLIAEVGPDRKTYPHLKYAPFAANLHSGIGKGWDDLTIEGFIAGKKVIERKMSGKGVDQKFIVEADDLELIADGIDMTRVVFRVADEFGNTRPFAQAAIELSVENGEIIGDNPFALIGGGGAVWVRSTEKAGVIKLRAGHPRLGTKTAEIKGVSAK